MVGRAESFVQFVEHGQHRVTSKALAQGLDHVRRYLPTGNPAPQFLEYLGVDRDGDAFLPHTVIVL